MQNTVAEISEKRRRPLGVSIMAILIAIQGFLELIIAAFASGGLVVIGHTLAVHGHTRTGTAIDILGWILGAIPLIVEFIKPHDSVGLIIAGMVLPIVILLYLFVDPNVPSCVSYMTFFLHKQAVRHVVTPRVGVKFFAVQIDHLHYDKVSNE